MTFFTREKKFKDKESAGITSISYLEQSYNCKQRPPTVVGDHPEEEEEGRLRQCMLKCSSFIVCVIKSVQQLHVLPFHQQLVALLVPAVGNILPRIY